MAGGTRFPITLLGNMTYRNFVRRIHMAKGFELPLPPLLGADVRTLPAAANTSRPVDRPDRARAA